ncbi:hypothetical protein KIN20_010979 [Parelaphostrongylus tenuis]|uniref:Uncharacterized protein n=1 Tax=Parelaphostrongylus tenuis TaxID=148309 RepID=A0AAD5QM61_PARTN|nr:hypothetical protein KIN20_010979 [Parelaphostrongylus tenuis]
MPSEDEDWQIMVDSLANKSRCGHSKESDAIMKRNLSTLDGGAEDGSVIDGPDDAQQANLDIADVVDELRMCDTRLAAI